MFCVFTSRKRDFHILYMGKNARVCPQNVHELVTTVGAAVTADAPKQKVRQTLCKNKYDEYIAKAVAARHTICI